MNKKRQLTQTVEMQAPIEVAEVQVAEGDPVALAARKLEPRALAITFFDGAFGFPVAIKVRTTPTAFTSLTPVLRLRGPDEGQVFIRSVVIEDSACPVPRFDLGAEQTKPGTERSARVPESQQVQFAHAPNPSRSPHWPAF